MKRKNTARNALFTSVISLLLCVSMLVGTTFAWFTDEVKSGTNVIAAGNLDVEIFNAIGIDQDKRVTTDTELFDHITYWEPGVVAYENLTVANMGTLALKYQLSVNFTDATATPDGKTLADVLQVGFVEGGIKSTTREGALTEVKVWQPLESFIQSGKLDSAKQDLTDAEVSDTYGIVIYWQPSDKDNDYNMNNGQTTALSINLGINMVATQLMAENDSFGKDYDANAILPWDGSANNEWYDPDETEYILYTAEDLAGLATLINGGNNLVGKTVKLGADIDLAGRSWTPINLWFPEGANNLVIDGNGHKISNMIVSANGNNAGFISTMTGNITIQNLTFENASVASSGNFIGTVVGYQYGNLVLNNVDVVDSEVYSTAAIGIRIGGLVGFSTNDSSAPATIKLENCDVSGTTIMGYHNLGGLVGTQMNTNYTYTNCSVKDCTIYARTTTEKYVDEIAVDGGAFDTEYSADVANNTVVCGAISNAAQLAAMSGTKTSGTYELVADLDMTGYEMKPIMLTSGSTNTLTFNGNGHTISNLTLVEDYQNGMYVAALFNSNHAGAEMNINDLTLTNVTSTAKKYAAVIVAYNSDGMIINLNNVDVDKATITAEGVGTLIGYTTNNANLTDCDVSNITLSGETAENKVGAYIGTANQASCAVTVTNCTNNSSYRDYGRVINGAVLVVDGSKVVNSADALADALTNGATNVTLTEDMTIASLPSGTADDLTIDLAPDTTVTVANGAAGGKDLTFTGDGTVKLVNTTPGYEGTLSYQDNSNLTFEGITFDASEISGICARGGVVTFVDCTINGELEKTIGSKFVFSGCTFTDGVTQAGYGCSDVVFENCKFETDGYGIKIYSEGQTPVNVTVVSCSFKNTGSDTKSAILLDHVVDGISYNITVENCTFEGYAATPTPTNNKWATRMIVESRNIMQGDQYVFSYQTGLDVGEGVNVGTCHYPLSADDLVVTVK